LEFVDEFIDNIAATACITAKLRESKTINLKDIQLILERHWSIRIPDSSAVKISRGEFNQVEAYHHKMTLLAQKQLAQIVGKKKV
jgi:transcription initiation factor TFIID subunit 12